jgi:hypothetical protein
LPMVCCEVVQQGNLLFQFIERLSIHGLLASSRRMRQAAGKSQARMVGALRKLPPSASQILVCIQDHRLTSLRAAHRRSVDGSGSRFGSRMLGTDCSQPPCCCQSRSAACCRQGRL